jgi:rhodanese-related sulfurtransferase
MKQLLCLIILLILTGCSRKINIVEDYQELDELLIKKANGDFKESLAYDLRSSDACNAGHIKGFTCIFYNSNKTVDDVFKDILLIYSKKAVIILICEEGRVAEDLAKRLFEDGYVNVQYFKGGYVNYQSQNLNFIPEIGCNC